MDQGITYVVGIDTKGSADNTTPAVVSKPVVSSPKKGTSSGSAAAGAYSEPKKRKHIPGGESSIVFG